jgi:hypothetical protein
MRLRTAFPRQNAITMHTITSSRSNWTGNSGTSARPLSSHTVNFVAEVVILVGFITAMNSPEVALAAHHGAQR